MSPYKILILATLQFPMLAHAFFFLSPSQIRAHAGIPKLSNTHTD